MYSINWVWSYFIHKVFERVNKHLKQGKNQVHFGQELVRLDSIVSTSGIATLKRKNTFNMLNTGQEDKITGQSLQLIEVCGCGSVF